MQVSFLSRTSAGEATPDAGHHLISISDGTEDQAIIDESRWASVSYHYFIDAGFDEDTIFLFGEGCEFETRFRDYFLEERAQALRKRIAAIVQKRQPIVVNCQAGRSRSAAVARFISSHYGYHLEQPTPDANMCVYRMLAKDASLLSAYALATAQKDEVHQDTETSFIGALKRLLGL
ncbi:dual specificity protein phosphatase family protein [Pseudomonas putida]|uniref:Dual specificity protein phosphatase family protein n=1 Tax=Pseudomonas putida TaxID=303 RepID=A0A7Y7ZFT5_PSEPU|nr:dual specificity protein phosphatase family protein [Pseudomonas putida]NWC84211.1 dual specificity protein phosphatase family protein [Pseudomonas putida]